MGDVVLTRPEPRLKTVALPAELTPEALARALGMFAVMRDGGGIGLAATQVGWDARLFVMEVGQAILVANPKIIRASISTEEAWEGCLSVPGLEALVRRPVTVKLEAEVATEDELRAGKAPQKATLKLSGLPARCAQHEMDHGSGVLIVDRSVRTRQRPPERG